MPTRRSALVYVGQMPDLGRCITDTSGSPSSLRGSRAPFLKSVPKDLRCSPRSAIYQHMGVAEAGRRRWSGCRGCRPSLRAPSVAEFSSSLSAAWMQQDPAHSGSQDSQHLTGLDGRHHKRAPGRSLGKTVPTTPSDGSPRPCELPRNGNEGTRTRFALALPEIILARSGWVASSRVRGGPRSAEPR